MADKFVHNIPQDPTKDIFVRLEEKVIDTSHNMSFLMVDLESKLKLFREVGGLNLEIGSNRKSGDNENC
jgi:hypothetical protein